MDIPHFPHAWQVYAYSHSSFFPILRWNLFLHFERRNDHPLVPPILVSSTEFFFIHYCINRSSCRWCHDRSICLTGKWWLLLVEDRPNSLNSFHPSGGFVHYSVLMPVLLHERIHRIGRISRSRPNIYQGFHIFFNTDPDPRSIFHWFFFDILLSLIPLEFSLCQNFQP